MANQNKRGLTSSSFERRSTKSEIEVLIVLTQSKSSIQKLPTFSLLESVYKQGIQIYFHD